ncbi:class D beta-lactamase [Nocardiopsis sp. NPDC060348]|uniref:class D beta-lactamase n=1 Tax=Nocardiopsis sp. NPDC060348 TaxID=3347102 RepID=UPI003656ECEE
MRTDIEHRARRRRAAASGVPALAAGCVLALVAGTGCAGAGRDGGAGGAEKAGTAAGGEEAADRSSARGDVATGERADLEALFSEEGVEGTFVLYDVRERTAAVVGPEEARERAVPASTFKLANTLIGLQTGAVEDVDEVLPHGGGPQPVPEWERDMSLREALPASNVPVYQELARRVGHERMAAWVDRFDYGNRSVGDAGSVDRFWLEGPLEISAMEQAFFLADLALADLPVDTGHQHALHEIATVEEGDGYTLYAKSGWGRGVAPAPGWWVGWVERGEDVYTFALRVEVEEDGDAGLREPLAREMLVELEALPPEAAGK